jgi:hypothetical protein
MDCANQHLLQKRGRGRPSKRTPETVERILSLIRSGNTFSTAACSAGIDPATFSVWRNQYPDFDKAVKKAESDAIARNCGLIQKAAINSWQAAAWWLERRYPNEFARTERLQHAGAQGKDLTIKILREE